MINTGGGFMFGPVQIVVIEFGYDAGGWRVDRHPRLLADLTGDGRPDIVGFADEGVRAAINRGNGSFGATHSVRTTSGHLLAEFGYDAGARVERHPRLIANLTRADRADIVGFTHVGVLAALNNGDGSFQDPQLVVANFGYDAGGWRVERHPRFLADLTGDGRADIVGFGNAGVSVAVNNGDGSFQDPQLVVANFGYDAGGWRVERHPRFLANLTRDGRADIVGFADDGVWVALNNGDGSFQDPQLVVANFGYDAGGWRVDRHPRLLADLTGDGRADIVGFGDDGVWVALNNGDGSFQDPQLVVANFGYDAGGWRVDRHPRLLANLTRADRADIVGFGNAGVSVAVNNGDGSFQDPQLVVANFGYDAGGWRVDRHPRLLGRPDRRRARRHRRLRRGGVSVALAQCCSKPRSWWSRTSARRRRLARRPPPALPRRPDRRRPRRHRRLRERRSVGGGQQRRRQLPGSAARRGELRLDAGGWRVDGTRASSRT